MALSSVAFYLYYKQFSNNGLSCRTEEFGAFGDYVGGVIGTIVAIYAAFYVYKTYKQQDRQSTKQQFENTFFQLLTQQRDIVKNLRGKIGSRNFSGYDYIRALHEELKVPMGDPEIVLLSGNNLRYKINDFYKDLFLEHTSQLGHYFRHMYHILKYVDKSMIEESEKKDYVDIVQAQMSSDELYIMAFNGISEYGHDKTYPLMEKYSLLENIVIEKDEIILYVIKELYPKTKMKYSIRSSNKVIFMGGVHCSGKTYFVGEISRVIKNELTVLTCSEVLEWNASGKEVDNISGNQKRLIFNLRDIMEDDNKYLLVGHYCLIDKGKNIQRLPLDTFRAINPCCLVLIEESTQIIYERLLERNNPDGWSKDLIERFVVEERQYADKIKRELGVELFVYNSSEGMKFKEDFIKMF